MKNLGFKISTRKRGRGRERGPRKQDLRDLESKLRDFEYKRGPRYSTRAEKGSRRETCLKWSFEGKRKRKRENKRKREIGRGKGNEL